MPARTDKLTDAQVAAMPAHAAKWVERGLDCTPAPRAEVEAGIRACYRLAGFAEPRVIVWVGSPVVGAFAVPYVAHLLQHDQVRGQVGGQVSGQVHGQVDDQVYGQVRGQVGDQVDDQVYGQVYGQVRGQVHGQVHDQVYGQVDGTWHRYIGGQWWAAWSAWADYFRTVCHLDPPRPDTWERLDAWTAANQAGWWWPQHGFVVVCERPEYVRGEQVGPAGWGSHRLHCDDGPAVRWRDGNTLHAWHGVQVPADLIERGWDTARILREDNAEVRRAAIERSGWDQFIADADLAQVGDTVPDPGNPGNTLALYDVPEAIYDEPVRVLLCTNGTPERDGTRRRFGLTVPADVDDPVTAAAWTYGLPGDVYATLERRS